jgi:hypothetical protein
VSESHDGNRLGPQFGLSLALGALTGASVTAIRVALQFDLKYFGLSDLVYLANLWLAHGLLAGGCLGGLAWIVLSPRERFVQAVRWLVGLNWASWVAFVLLTSPAPAADFEEAARARSSGGAANWITDAPTLMAGRYFGGWVSMPLSERFFVTMAEPAVFIAESQVKPLRFVLFRPTRRESYVIGAIAFAISTGFWAIVGTAVSRVQRRVRLRKSLRTLD